MSENIYAFDKNKVGVYRASRVFLTFTASLSVLSIQTSKYSDWTASHQALIPILAPLGDPSHHALCPQDWFNLPQSGEIPD